MRTLPKIRLRWTKESKEKRSPNETFYQYIDRLVALSLSIIGHSEYSPSVNYPKKDHKDSNEVYSVRAQCCIDTVYLNISIEIFPALRAYYNAKRYREVGLSILHETCHLLTEPLGRELLVNVSPSLEREFREIIERQTERTTKIAALAMPKEWYIPAKLKELFEK